MVKAAILMALTMLSTTGGAHANERTGFAVTDLTLVAPHAIEIGGQ